MVDKMDTGGTIVFFLHFYAHMTTDTVFVSNALLNKRMIRQWLNGNLYR